MGSPEQRVDRRASAAVAVLPSRPAGQRRVSHEGAWRSARRFAGLGESRDAGVGASGTDTGGNALRGGTRRRCGAVTGTNRVTGWVGPEAP